MTTTNPTNPGCTDALCRVTDLLLRAGVKDAAALTTSAELHQALMQAIHQWCTGVACRKYDASLLGMDDEALTDAFIGLVFRAGERGDYPSLNRLLEIARKDGADAVVRYLTTLMKHYFGLLWIRRGHHQIRLQALRSLVPGAGEPDAQKVWDDRPFDKVAMQGTLAALGQDPARFIEDVVILADALQVDRSTVTDLLSRGEQDILLSRLTLRLTYFFGEDMAAALTALEEQARAFVLPEPFAADAGALGRFIDGQPEGPAHVRLASRDSAGAP